MNKNANNIDERQAKGLSILSGTLLPFARNLLGKKGFIEVDIITKWADIVGKELAGYSFPQKISFKKGCKNDGTLYLCVTTGAFALEIQHREKYILDKINTYFGYNAVSGIKIIQNQQAAATNPDLVNEYEKPYAYKLNKEEEEDTGVWGLIFLRCPSNRIKLHLSPFPPTSHTHSPFYSRCF